MSFGRRRFQSLVMQGEGDDAHLVAYFLPLDTLDAPGEFEEEERLRALLAAEPHIFRPEEQFAVKAFDQVARGKKGSRSTAEAAIARQGQTSFVDPLNPQERALVERWRKLITVKTLPRTVRPDCSSDDALASSRHDLDDLTQRVLAEVLDVYLPRGA